MYRQSQKMLNANILPICPHNTAKFGPLPAEIGWRVWGIPTNFNGFRVGFVTAATSLNGGQQNFSLFGRLLDWYTIYTFSAALASDGILPGAKFNLRPTFVFSYIGSDTARHSSSGVSQTLWRWEECATCVRQGGHHVGHRPTFWYFLLYT